MARKLKLFNTSHILNSHVSIMLSDCIDLMAERNGLWFGVIENSRGKF